MDWNAQKWLIGIAAPDSPVQPELLSFVDAVPILMPTVYEDAIVPSTAVSLTFAFLRLFRQSSGIFREEIKRYVQEFLRTAHI